ADHTHKQDAGPTYKLKVTGSGTWQFNLDDSMTEDLDYTATIEEEQLPDMVRQRYVLRLSLRRLPPTEEPERPKTPADPPKPAPTPPPEPMPPKNEPAPKPEAAKEPKPEPKPQAKDDKPPAEAKPQVSEEQQEKLAQSRLKQARQLIEFGKTEDAIEYCEQILKRWPNTKAAQEAADLLKKLKR
ncbi:MAG: hypothetical protein NZM31_04490, partial [Gemmatales bacterium]|nr:hypothetical protein [Gemmatales bacterium]MDW8386259.1 hypothetical protein [Gemmatales bacterium]